MYGRDSLKSTKDTVPPGTSCPLDTYGNYSSSILLALLVVFAGLQSHSQYHRSEMIYMLTIVHAPRSPLPNFQEVVLGDHLALPVLHDGHVLVENVSLRDV